MYIGKTATANKHFSSTATETYRRLVNPVSTNDVLGVDSVSISAQAKAMLAGTTPTNPMNALTAIQEHPLIPQALDFLSTKGSEKSQDTDDLLTCIKIAMRIMNGDRVPMKDERFLAETQPKMYANAIMLRRINKDAKDYDSILEEEKSTLSDRDSTNDASDAIDPSISDGSTQSTDGPDIPVDIVVD